MQQLLCHSSNASTVIQSVEAIATYDPTGRIHFDYALHGDIAALKLAARTEPARVDELWQSTCFEAFLGLPDSEIYFEFNFSPSGLWAAYRFERFREERSAPPLSPAPAIDLRRTQDALLLSAHVDIRKWRELDMAAYLDCGLTAVIETEEGELSYWALAHPESRPDFHNRDCFTYRLDAPSAA